VRKVIERHRGNRSEAARALGISRGTLRAHLKLAEKA
jgi:DNA-binding protein Fis